MGHFLLRSMINLNDICNYIYIFVNIIYFKHLIYILFTLNIKDFMILKYVCKVKKSISYQYKYYLINKYSL